MATDFFKDLPPTTLHVRIISSPSSMGPTVVLFIIRPQRSRIIGGSGKTEKEVQHHIKYKWNEQNMIHNGYGIVVIIWWAIELINTTIQNGYKNISTPLI